jgi:hypothetical protein
MKDEKLRMASVYAAIAKGEADMTNGKTIEFSENMMTEISTIARQNSLKGKKVKGDIKS